MRKLSIKGILLGGVADIVATNILAVPLLIYVTSTLDLANTPKDQVSSTIISVMHSQPTFYVMQLFIGLSCSVLGGYVAARLAKHDELLNGILSSWLCIAFGLYGLFAGNEHASTLAHVAGFVGSPAAALFGGYLRLKQKPVL